MKKPTLLTWVLIIAVVLLPFVARPIDQMITDAIATPTITPIPINPFYLDTFSGGLGDWSEYHFTRNEQAEFEAETNVYSDGIKLLFDINLPKTYLYLFNDKFSYDDIRIEAQFTNYGKNTNYVSLICRYSPFTGWYEFNVSNSGQASVLRYSNEDDFILIGEGGIENMKRNTGSNISVNKIAVECQGDELTLIVNDVKWRTFKDLI